MNQSPYEIATDQTNAQTSTMTPNFVRDADLPLQRIYQSEQQQAGSILFTQPWNGKVQEWTWAQTLQETRRVAAFLKAQNYPPGSRIAIMAKNCAWWIMADIAIWMAGHVSIPIFPTVQDSSLLAIFTQAEPVACFLGSVEHLPSLDQACFRSMQWITFPHQVREGMTAWNDVIQEYPPLSESPLRAADDIATIIYTSGTTGSPKGVMHAYRSLSLMAIAVQRAIGSADNKQDRMLSYLPLAHIAERAIVEMSAFFMPLHIYFTEGQSTFLVDLQRSQATIFFTIPRLLIRFQQGVLEKLPQKKLGLLLQIPLVNTLIRRKVLKGLGLEHVRLAASGAAPLPPSVIHWYHALGLNLVEGYGMTETGITHVPSTGRDRVGYVGEEFDFSQTRISLEGEIQIKGPMNFAGYYKNTAATAASFTADGYFKTGDRGEIDEAGRLKIVGRLKEEFKTSKGKYVFPAQIEKALSLCPYFESVCVLGSGMTSPFAMAVLNPQARLLCATPAGRATVEHSLISNMEIVNAQHEHHERLCFLALDDRPWTPDNGLLTPTLKVRRSFIEERYGTQFESWSQLEKKVIWLEDQ